MLTNKSHFQIIVMINNGEIYMNINTAVDCSILQLIAEQVQAPWMRYTAMFRRYSVESSENIVQWKAWSLIVGKRQDY